MKLTTKLLISLGLTLIVGAQAFASNKSFYVNIVNKNCPQRFRLEASGYDPFVYHNFDVLPGKSSGYIKVPAGGGAGVANWDNVILGSSLLAPLPNRHYRIVFRMLGFLCFPDV